MKHSIAYGAHAYADVGLETAVASASPHGLIVLLYDGAIQAISNARQRLATGDVSGKAKNIAKAVDIINKGLNASLDPVVGGKLAQDLKALYTYMCGQLVLANLNNDVRALDEVHGLLTQLRQAWNAIGDSPAARAHLTHSRTSGSLTA